jgi:hypothetical protein
VAELEDDIVIMKRIFHEQLEEAVDQLAAAREAAELKGPPAVLRVVPSVAEAASALIEPKAGEGDGGT